jgi:hypothetical protein
MEPVALVSFGGPNPMRKYVFDLHLPTYQHRDLVPMLAGATIGGWDFFGMIDSAPPNDGIAWVH